MRQTKKPKITMFIGDQKVEHFPEDYKRRLAEVIGETISKCLTPEQFDEISARLKER